MSFGHWFFDEERLALVHANLPLLIFVKNCYSAAELLGMFADLANSAGICSADLGDLLLAFLDLGLLPTTSGRRRA